MPVGGTNGPGPYPALLTQYVVSGTFDTIFGNQGLIIAQFSAQEVFNGVEIQPDGKFVVAGGSAVAGESTRYNADGRLPTTVARPGSGAGSATVVAQTLPATVAIAPAKPRIEAIERVPCNWNDGRGVGVRPRGYDELDEARSIPPERPVNA